MDPSSLRALSIVALVAALASTACGRGGARDAVPRGSSSGRPEAEAGHWFVDRTKEAGLDFVHFNGMSGALYYPEIMAPGVALFDYDNDGDLDVYLVQGQMLGAGETASAVYPPPSSPGDRLFRNDLTVGADGTRTLRFTDVTASARVNVSSYGMGVATGDFDNDGWVDIYRTGLGSSVLLHNNGDGTFSDVTARAGVGNAGGWSVPAAFVDYDRDGRLDLFVGNYLIYRVEADIACRDLAGRRDYCPPTSYRAQPDRLYHNKGGGVFEDVTRRALIGGADGPALGVSTADFNGDGWIDIYVGNDGTPNQLWINQKDGTFKDAAFLSGVAVSGAGQSEASMGIDAGDYDNDGDEDLFVTNWATQMNVLYVNDGTGLFEDRRAASGLGPPSLAKTGFGTGWLDFDTDGWLDLFVANGSVARIETQIKSGDLFPLRMAKQLYRNRGDGRFADVSADAGAPFRVPQVGRGVAFGDVDNDGDTDIVIGNTSGPVELLMNEGGSRGHWIGLRLVDADGRRDMLGTRVAVVRDGAPTLWRRARADGSYASANDPRVLVGLGADASGPRRVRVEWPDGRREEWPAVPVDRWTELREGSAR